MLSKIGADGRPRKVAYGAGIARLFPWLAKLKHLRGTPFDPFGYTAERRMERRLIREYESDMKRVLSLPAADPEAVRLLARLPLQIRGFGPVKHANAKAAATRRAELLKSIEAGPAAVKQAAA